jgi:hypothetical protein
LAAMPWPMPPVPIKPRVFMPSTPLIGVLSARLTHAVNYHYREGAHALRQNLS